VSNFGGLRLDWVQQDELVAAGQGAGGLRRGLLAGGAGGHAETEDPPFSV